MPDRSPEIGQVAVEQTAPASTPANDPNNIRLIRAPDGTLTITSADDTDDSDDAQNDDEN